MTLCFQKPYPEQIIKYDLVLPDLLPLSYQRSSNVMNNNLNIGNIFYDDAAELKSKTH